VKYRLTAAADRDLLGIFLASLKMFGPLQAQRYYEGLLSDLNYITEYPESARERAELRSPSRFHHYGSHVIVYVVGEKEIVIRRILHGRQDTPRHLR
jgi:toxin ParE1/3/4